MGAHYETDRFHLVGHDWGGIVAWGVGISHSDRLERLVIMKAPHPDLWAHEACAGECRNHSVSEP